MLTSPSNPSRFPSPSPRVPTSLESKDLPSSPCKRRQELALRFPKTTRTVRLSTNLMMMSTSMSRSKEIPSLLPKRSKRSRGLSASAPPRSTPRSREFPPSSTPSSRAPGKICSANPMLVAERRSASRLTAPGHPRPPPVHLGPASAQLFSLLPTTTSSWKASAPRYLLSRQRSSVAPLSSASSCFCSSSRSSAVAISSSSARRRCHLRSSSIRRVVPLFCPLTRTMMPSPSLDRLIKSRTVWRRQSSWR